ncbi:armadillo-type protein [Zopfochytrium polystomum]|nr:armadillo-type protein [Zopfochytrium polystomum]
MSRPDHGSAGVGGAVALPSLAINIEERVAAADSIEKKEQIVFQWLSSVERDLERSSTEKAAIAAAQPSVQALLFKILTGTVPRPTRPIRQLVGRIYVLIFTLGETRTLFDCLASIQGILNQKKLDDVTIRIAAIHCIGVISETVGQKVLSLFAESVSLLLRSLRSVKESEVVIRYEILQSLSKGFKGCGKGATDATCKDVIKVARAALADKLFVIRSAGAELMEMIYRHTVTARPVKLEEFDSLLAVFFKALEGSNYHSRRSIASAAGLIASFSQTMKSKIPAKKGVKPSTQVEGGTGDDSTILSVDEMCALFSNHFGRTSLRDVRVGVIESFGFTFRELGLSFVESNFTTIVKHIVELISNPKNTPSDAEACFMRELGSFLFRDIIGKMLPEASQLMALKDLTHLFLKRWSSSGITDFNTTSLTLVFVLNEVSFLISELGAAVSSVEDVLYDNLMNLIAYPALLVNLSLAWCFKTLCYAHPRILTRVVDKLISNLQKDTSSLTTDKPDTIPKFVGLANCLASAISVIQYRSLHVSLESAAVVFGIATQLLKLSSTGKDAKVANTQMRVGWTLLGSLVTLGPNFVKVHLSQLLLFWKNIFPKPTASKENSTNRGETEWHTALLTRDCALACLQSFLERNSDPLVSIDVAKRIVVCLNNCATFLGSVPQVYPSASGNFATRKRLVELESSVKKRLLNCFRLVKPMTSFETSYEALTRLCVQTFAPDPDVVVDRVTEPMGSNSGAGSSATAVAKGNQGPFDLSLANTLIAIELALGTSGESRSGLSLLAPRDTDLRRAEMLVELRTANVTEFDTASAFSQSPRAAQRISRPITVGTVNASIELFGLLFPLQSAQVQENTIEQLIKYSKYNGVKMSGARKLALQLNAATALLFALRAVIAKHGSLASERIPVATRDLVEEMLSSPVPILRGLACETLGLLSRVVSSGGFVNQLVQNLVDQIVNNREPHSRAGCALALGCIHNHAGGMAIGAHLKTSVGILHSLSSDSHPLVHEWALHALWLTIESSGLMFGPYVNSTLSLMTKLMMADSHDIAAGGSAFTAAENNMNILPTLGKILYAVVGVIGPELESLPRVRELCFCLFEEYKNDSDFFVAVEAIKCIQQFIIFAPKTVDMPKLIPFLQLQLGGGNPQQIYLLRKAAVTCLYQLTRKDPGLVLSAAANGQLEEQLFALLDVETDQTVRDEIKDILTSLLRFVAPSRPSRWLDLCKNILAKGGSAAGAGAPNAPTTQPDEEDEDVEVGAKPVTPPKDSTKVTSQPASSIVLLPRWQTQVFALSSLRQVLTVISESGKKDHFDLELARASGPEADFLVLRVSDLIRMAFNSATAPVHNLRLEGLFLLQDVLEKFAQASDPDFEGHSLLEQFQAQISAALTPAFALDSSPHITSLACGVLAVYLGTGINKDVGSLSRVLKLLTGMLESSEAETPNLCSHERAMLKLAILTSWAEVKVFSEDLKFLQPVVEPHLQVLGTLWTSILREYARMKIDVDAITLGFDDASGSTTADMYIAATRDVISPFYKESWPVILDAFTSLTADHKAIVDTVMTEMKESESKYDLPGILLGLAVESISREVFGGSSAASPSNDNNALFKSRTSTLATCLISIQRLFSNGILTAESLPKGVYVELLNLFDRVLQVGGFVLALLRQDTEHLVEINSTEDALGSADSLTAVTAGDFKSFSKLFATAKLILNVFLHHVPYLSNSPTATVTAYQPPTADVFNLLSLSLDVICSLVCRIPLTEQLLSQLIPITLFIFSIVFATEKFAAELSPKLLLSVRQISEVVATNDLAVGSPVIAGAFQSFVVSLLDLVDECFDADPIDVAKLKSPLLAAALVLTTIQKMDINIEIQERLAGILNDLLKSNIASATLLGLQCIRSIATMAVKARASADGTAAPSSSYTRLLLPQVVAFLLRQQSNSRPIESVVLDEAVKILVLHCVGENNLLGPVIQILVDLISDAESDMYAVCARALFQLATHYSAEFKSYIVSLPAHKKGNLEGAFKMLVQTSGGAPNAPAPISNRGTPSGSTESLNGGAAQPKIKLMTFA